MILVAPKMEKQCDYEMKVENFKVYLKKVSQLIAGGVRYVLNVIALCCAALLKFL